MSEDLQYKIDDKNPLPEPLVDNVYEQQTYNEVIGDPAALIQPTIIGGNLYGGSARFGTENNVLKFNSVNGLWLGNTAFSLAPFSVSLAGALTASSITITGGILKYGKISFSDSTNAGYYLDSSGWYVGSAANATYLKYTLADGTLVFVGNHSGGTVGGQPVANVGYVATTTADAVPTGLTASTTGITTATDGTTTAFVTLTWTALSTNTFDHYIIRYKKATYTYYQYTPSNTNNITIDGLVPNLSYNFGIASVNKYGSVSAYSSDIASSTAADTTPPATVTIGSATSAIQSVIVKWTHNTETDLASYNIYRNTSDNSGTSTLIGNIRTNYFVDSGLTGGTAVYYWVKALDTSGNLSTNFSSSVTATPRNVASSDTNIAHQGWTQTCAFAVTDADTVSWGTGTFTTSAGTSYSISAGNTGNMSARTYIYLDIAVSLTAYQVTTTASTAVGDGKVLIGVAQNGTGEAIFQIFGGYGGVYINGSDLVTGSVTTNEIAANTIQAGNIEAGTITATQIDTDTITSLDNLVIGAPQVLIDGSVTFLNSWLSYKGTYGAGITYSKGDQVLYLTNYWNYINTTPSSGNTPAENTYWTAGGALQLTTIDGGEITAATITTSKLNFTAVETGNVIASINSSAEGITIDADNITISGSTTFTAGYDPSIKRRVFVAEPTTPYDIGDLWVNGSVFYKCKTAAVSGAFNAAHWELATAYTGTFAQDAIPTSLAIGDLWVDTNDNNKLYRAASIGADQITAGEWVAVPDGNKINVSGAAADINANVTTISGGKITTDTITATQISSAYVYAGAVAANQITAGTGVINALSVLSTLTMGSAATDGYIQSYGWNGTVNGFQIKGGVTPAFNIIGGFLSTGSSGARIEIDTDSVEIFDASNLIGELSAAAGQLNIICNSASPSGIFLNPGSVKLDGYDIEVTLLTDSDTTGKFYPSAGTVDLGGSSNKFYNLYLGGSITVDGTVDGVDIAAHTHTGGAGGTVAHSSLGSIGANDHHAQSHSHGSHSGIGASDHHSSTSNALDITPTSVTVGTNSTTGGSVDIKNLSGSLAWNGQAHLSPTGSSANLRCYKNFISHNHDNLGDATYYWNDIQYKTLTDVGCLGSFDNGVELQDGRIVSDIEAIKSIKEHPTLKTVYGVPRFDYRTMPKAVYKKAMMHGIELQRDKDDKPFSVIEGKIVYAQDGAETTALISIMIGAIKELNQKIDNLKK